MQQVEYDGKHFAEIFEGAKQDEVVAKMNDRLIEFAERQPVGSGKSSAPKLLSRTFCKDKKAARRAQKLARKKNRKK